MIVHSVAARAGLLGNPSDGYGGRTLALEVPALGSATVSMEVADDFVVETAAHDRPAWGSLAEGMHHLDRFGFGRADELVLAAVRRFWDVAPTLGADLPAGLHIRHTTTIPRQVGLAGSSAVVVATMRGLAELAGVEVPPDVLATLAWEAETEYLGITAGLQDRVVQAYGGLVAMDFGELTTAPGFGVAVGRYESLDAGRLPKLFVAVCPAAAEPSGTYHRDLRRRWEAGDRQVREALRQLAALVNEGRAALRWRATEQFGPLLAENMRLRSLLGPLPERQYALVEVAAEHGAPATFAGSGGAVIGVWTDDAQLDELRRAYAAHDAQVVVVVDHPEGSNESSS